VEQNPQLRQYAIQMVENQLEQNDPPFVQDKYEELKGRYSENRAKEMIARKVIEQVYQMQQTESKFDSEQYKQDLAELE
jgi:hypothetical protein